LKNSCLLETHPSKIENTQFWIQRRVRHGNQADKRQNGPNGRRQILVAKTVAPNGLIPPVKKVPFSPAEIR